MATDKTEVRHDAKKAEGPVLVTLDIGEWLSSRQTLSKAHVLNSRGVCQLGPSPLYRVNASAASPFVITSMLYFSTYTFRS